MVAPAWCGRRRIGWNRVSCLSPHGRGVFCFPLTPPTKRRGVVELADDETGTTDRGLSWTGNGLFCCPVANLQEG
jgi:hypothetical protein